MNISGNQSPIPMSDDNSGTVFPKASVKSPAGDQSRAQQIILSQKELGVEGGKFIEGRIQAHYQDKNETAPDIKLVAQRMGITPVKSLTEEAFSSFVNEQVESILDQYYPGGAPSYLGEGRESMGKILKCAIENSLLAPAGIQGENLTVGSTQYTITQELNSRNFVLIEFTGQEYGRGSYAVADKVRTSASGSIQPFKRAADTPRGGAAAYTPKKLAEWREMAKKDVANAAQMTTDMEQRGKKQGIDPNKMRYLERAPSAIAKALTGQVGFIPSEVFGPNLDDQKVDRPQSQRCQQSGQICKGLEAVEELSLCWADGKPENVVTVDGEIRLTDFGGSKFYDQLVVPTHLDLLQQSNSYEGGGIFLLHQTDVNPTGVTFTPAYFPIEHRQRLITAIENQDQKAYTEAHKQAELFKHASLLFEELTGCFISSLRDYPQQHLSLVHPERSVHVERVLGQLTNENPPVDIDATIRAMDPDDNSYVVLDSVIIGKEEIPIYLYCDKQPGEAKLFAPDASGNYGEHGYVQSDSGQWVEKVPIREGEQNCLSLQVDDIAIDIMLDKLGLQGNPDGDHLRKEFKNLFKKAVNPDPEKSISTDDFLKQFADLNEKLKKFCPD